MDIPPPRVGSTGLDFYGSLLQIPGGTFGAASFHFRKVVRGLRSPKLSVNPSPVSSQGEAQSFNAFLTVILTGYEKLREPRSVQPVFGKSGPVGWTGWVDSVDSDDAADSVD